MDTQAYIASGIIERYALGQATCYEAMELGEFAERYPDVRIALAQALEAVDGLAQAASVPPPPALRDKVLHAVSLEARSSELPSSGKVQQKAQPAGSVSGGTIRRMVFRTGLAAALVLAAGLTLIWQNRQTQEAEQRSAALEREVEGLTGQLSLWQAQNQQQLDQLALLRDGATRRIALLPLPGIDQARVDVYWNPERQQAFFDVLDLPEIPAGKQYQLWAIVDGSPVDMGLLPLDTSADAWQAFPFVPSPQAFAITVEPQGGSPVPSLDQMVVIGSIPSS